VNKSASTPCRAVSLKSVGYRVAEWVGSPGAHVGSSEPEVRPHPRPSRALTAQSGVTLGWEQGEPVVLFPDLPRCDAKTCVKPRRPANP